MAISDKQRELALKIHRDMIEDAARRVGLCNRTVYCLTCGREESVANGLREGWPKCCGYTMTLDHPSTREKR